MRAFTVIASACVDPARRAWGIAFPTAAERDAHDPTGRLRAARVGELTPPRLPDYEHDGGAWLRAAGTWDELPFALGQDYRRAGREAQARFWGEGDPGTSMLHQIALQAGGAR